MGGKFILLFLIVSLYYPRILGVQEVVLSLRLFYMHVYIVFGFRWVPPSLPTEKSPDPEKESGATYAAGRSRVVLHFMLMASFILL